MRRTDLRVAGRRLHSRSDPGRATPTSPAPRRDNPVTCHAYGKRVARKGRFQIHCSRRCRQRAYWDRHVLAAVSSIVTHDTGHSTIPRKSTSNIKGLQKAISRRVRVAIPPEPSSDFNDVLTGHVVAKINEARHVD